MSLAHKLGSCMDKESLKRMATSEVAMRQGMCLALGASAVPECANMSTKYVRERMFNYASYDYVADEKVKNATVDTFVQEIRQLMRELMQKGQLQNAPVDSNAVLDEPHHHRSKIGQTPPDFVLQNQTCAPPLCI
jgi:alcohol dehydrogenase class IV